MSVYFSFIFDRPVIYKTTNTLTNTATALCMNVTRL